ncbi:3-oxoacyl-ACP reductase FabG [Brevibacterium luteolum]|uniref:3-oxoacyl-ACP reductase FabG n=1 Tax=Brevibacterium luteolum TaxID=199591 RepID=UPI0021AF8448|nr:3-oxoacyl-ACP reductase FabG [Brevibacterium luteolum]MCT1872588.1 3-oxoacyl-ACP reductase FabG [Brevibacterium luteolum]MCT1890561.1 3-oxoacyl-ACP reductase FabG [Brevibacterium luteolum]MCT1893051.1 3-oxoacyl-ACP reductase FabG [Brevibacterium luteolum]MCT1923843.1 3-oxoacyl-ACP reductase FabG [Brevibacterium luteolum]
MKNLLEGRTAVITGAAQGLGYAIAETFVAEGANVVLGDLNEEAVVEAAEKLGVGDRAVGRACNVVSLADVEALCTTAVDTFGSLDVMVNNAGITRDATMRKMTEEQFDQVTAVHLRGTWNGLKTASGIMREQENGGSIINVSSISGKVGMLGQTNYSAAKAGIVGMTKAAAKEVGFKNVRVNAIQPGFINTAMTAAMRQDVIDAKLAEIPMGRAGEPSEVASVVLFLASDMSGYLTGTVTEISGGRHI